MLQSAKWEILLFTAVSVCIFSFCNETSAQTVLDTSIGFRQEYNSNVLYTRNDELDDYISYFFPSVRLKHRTELFEVSVLADWESLFYWDFDELNTTNQNYVLDSSYRMTERLSVSANGRYLKDTTLDSQLEETGIVGIRQDRERTFAGLGTSYDLSERSSLGVNYDYQDTEFDRETSIDSEVHDFQLAYTRRLKNQVDTISLFPLVSYATSEEWDIWNYTLNLQWRRRFSETLNGSFSVGVRNTQIDFKNDDDDSDTWGSVLDLRLSKRGEITRGRISLNNDLRTDSDGNVFNVTRLLANIDHRFSPRFGAGIQGGVWYSRELEEQVANAEGDRWFFRVSPSIFYLITRNHRLRLLYSYDQETKLDLDTDRRRERHRIWLELIFNFPDTWSTVFS